jgi:hypothetical protein
MQVAEKVEANWQEGYCFITTMPNLIQLKQPRREFKNDSGNFLNIRLTARTWPPSDVRLVGPVKTTLVTNISLMTKRLKQRRLRQWLKDFCAAGFDAQVKRWDACMSVGGGYVEK